MNYTDYDLQATVKQKLDRMSANTVKGLSLFVNEWKTKIIDKDLIRIDDTTAPILNLRAEDLIEALLTGSNKLDDYVIKINEESNLVLESFEGIEYECNISYNFSAMRHTIVTVPGSGFTTMEWVTIMWLHSLFVISGNDRIDSFSVEIPIWRNIEDIEFPASYKELDLPENSRWLTLPKNDPSMEYGTYEIDRAVPYLDSAWTEGSAGDDTDYGVADYFLTANLETDLMANGLTLTEWVKTTPSWESFINSGEQWAMFEVFQTIVPGQVYRNEYNLARYTSGLVNMVYPVFDDESVGFYMSIDSISSVFKDIVTTSDMLIQAIDNINNSAFNFVDNFGFPNLATDMTSILRDPSASGSSKIKRLLSLFYDQEDPDFYSDGSETYYGINPFWSVVNGAWEDITTGLLTKTVQFITASYRLYTWIRFELPKKIYKWGTKFISKAVSPVSLTNEVISIPGVSIDETFFWPIVETMHITNEHDLYSKVFDNNLIDRTINLSLDSALILFTFHFDESSPTELMLTTNTYLRPTMVDMRSPNSLSITEANDLFLLKFKHPNLYENHRFDVINDDSLWDDSTFWYTMFAAAMSANKQLYQLLPDLDTPWTNQFLPTPEDVDYLYLTYSPVVGWPRSMGVKIYDEGTNWQPNGYTWGPFNVYGYNNPTNADFKHAITQGCSYYGLYLDKSDYFDSNAFVNEYLKFTEIIVDDFLSNSFTDLIVFENNRELSHGVRVKSDMENVAGQTTFFKNLAIALIVIGLTIAFFKVRSRVRKRSISLEAQRHRILTSPDIGDDGNISESNIKRLSRINRNIRFNNKLRGLLFLPTQASSSVSIPDFSLSSKDVHNDSQIKLEKITALIK